MDNNNNNNKEVEFTDLKYVRGDADYKSGDDAELLPVEKEAIKNLNFVAEQKPFRVNCCSHLLFIWPTWTILKGLVTTLKPKDFPPLQTKYRCKSTYEKAMHHWDQQVKDFEQQKAEYPAQLEKWKEQGSNPKEEPDEPFVPRVSRTVREMLGVWFWIGIIFGVMQGFISTYGRSKVLKELLKGMIPSSPELHVQRNIPINGTNRTFLYEKTFPEGHFYEAEYTDLEMHWIMAIFGILVFVEGWLKNISTQLLSTDFGNTFVSFIIPLVQRKAAKASDAKPKKTPGKKKPGRSFSFGGSNAAKSNEANLVGNDVIQTYENSRWFATCPQIFSGFIFGIYTLIDMIGAAPAMVGLSVMILCLIINMCAAIKSSKYSALDFQAGDARLKTMRELIESIQPVKFMCWEDEYLKLLGKQRDTECNYQLAFRMLILVNITLGKCSPTIAACIAFTYMYQNDYTMDAPTIFSGLAAFNALRMPLVTLPFQFIQYAMLHVSFGRIQKFLLSPEYTPPSSPTESDVIVKFENATVSWYPPKDKLVDLTPKKKKKKKGKKSPEKVVVAEDKVESGDVAAKKEVEDEQAFEIKNLNITIKKGELVGVCGRVGCGKSTLLCSVIGETYLKEGGARSVCEQVGYVPQKPFILSGTIIENITMGREYDAKSVKEAIRNAAFDKDLDLMPDRLGSEIGERGTTLSGGQKQRLAVARAVYQDPELLIVDDALAAVDGQVAKNIFDRVCISRKQKNLTTLIALNQLQFLNELDKIIFLEDGNVSGYGTYDELIKSNEEFKKMITFANEEDGDLDGIEDPKSAPNTPVISKATLEDGSSSPSSKEGKRSPTNNNTDGKDHKLFVDEKAKEGGYSAYRFWKYLSAAGGVPFIFAIIVTYGGAYFLYGMTDIWLAQWVSTKEEYKNISKEERLDWYLVLTFSTAAAMFTCAATITVATNRANRVIHKNVVTKLLHAPTSWYEERASGEIISRFSG